MEIGEMSKKRKYNFVMNDDNLQNVHVNNKHTLDSDEEDSDDYENDLCDSDIEGEEDGVSKVQDDVKITPFNMREELEEGHFDKDGQYHWNKSNDIKDNWLDNIDWVRIEKQTEASLSADTNEATSTAINIYNEKFVYKKLLSYMIEGETVANALRRLGINGSKINSVERLKLKKQGITNENEYKITKLTELANEILTKTGNMDIYQMTYESIQEKVNNIPGTSKNDLLLARCGFDMYSDDFNEKDQLHQKNSENYSNEKIHESNLKELQWEFKWKEKDTYLQGPFNTNQMLKWSKDGYFKDGVYVRKVGEVTNFYRSNRIDFDLYL